jgi:hypothetical protein
MAPGIQRDELRNRRRHIDFTDVGNLPEFVSESRHRSGYERRLLAHLYGPAARCKLNLQNGSGWSCASVSGPWVEQIAPGHHGCPRAFGLNSAIGPRRPDGPPDHERDGETRSPSLKFNSQTSAGYLLLPSGALGLTKRSLRSHRRSLAPIGERRWRRRVAVIPLVNQSELMLLLR